MLKLSILCFFSFYLKKIFLEYMNTMVWYYLAQTGKPFPENGWQHIVC